VTLFISGDGGWNLGVVGMAEHLVDLGSVVVGIDVRHYRDQVNRDGPGCQYFGGDFEDLSHTVQQRLGLDQYLLPVLAGYSSGATLAYAVAVQSPKGTYAGALSLGVLSRPRPQAADLSRGRTAL
jgi:type IV secretory pathway VirJ component